MPASVLPTRFASAVQAVLAGAPSAYLAIETRSGPHVTPELHLWWRDRLWLVVARDTLKSRVVRKRPRVGAVLSTGDDSVVLIGEAKVIDPLTPSSFVDGLPESLGAGVALGRYAIRHAGNLSGFVADVVGRRVGLGTLGPRVLLVVCPTATALVEGGRVRSTGGSWPGRRPRLSHGPGPERDAPDLSAVPDSSAALADTRRRCVLGWAGPSGPTALPGWWLPDSSTALVPSSLFVLAGLGPHSAASVTLDADERWGPAGKLGLIIRGEGVAAVAGDWATVAIDTAKVTWWQGDRVETNQT